MIGPVGRPDAPPLRAGAYGPPGRAYCAAVSVPAQLERGTGRAGLVRLDGHGHVQRMLRSARDNPGMATLRQRVNFAGVSSARCEEARTGAQ